MQGISVDWLIVVLSSSTKSEGTVTQRNCSPKENTDVNVSAIHPEHGEDEASPIAY